MYSKDLTFLSHFLRVCRRAGLGVGLLLLPTVAAAAEEDTAEFFESSLGFYQAEDACVFGAVKAAGGNTLGILSACSQEFDAHQAHLEDAFNNRAVRVFMHFRKLDAVDKATVRYRNEQGR